MDSRFRGNDGGGAYSTLIQYRCGQHPGQNGWWGCRCAAERI